MRYLVYQPVPDEYGDTEYVVIGRDLKEFRFIDGNPKWRLEDELQSLFYYVARSMPTTKGMPPPNVIIPGESREPIRRIMGQPDCRPAAPGLDPGRMERHGTSDTKATPDGGCIRRSGVIDCETDRDMTFGVGGFLSPRLDSHQCRRT